LPDRRRRRQSGWIGLLFLVAGCLLVVACTHVPVPSGASRAPAPGETSAVSGLPASIDPLTGFAFAADDVVAYYEGQGYACIAPRPSTTAAGFTFQSCLKVDPAGRTRTVAVVTDPEGRLADGLASVLANGSETVVAPADALEPLSGFLGAMLGEEQGAQASQWLTDHLGAAYEQTTLGLVTLATYTGANDDPSVLYVELANHEYLEAPVPSS
jgi:hypothetical protein